MAQFFVPPENFVGDKVQILGSEAKHLSRVLRKNPGDHLRIFDGQGKTYEVEIEKINGNRVEAKILSTLPNGEIIARVHLFPALLKFLKMDYLFQKVTELGVEEITPIITEHTVVRLTREKAEDKITHWQKVALNAAKQCGRAKLPTINPVMEFEEALKKAKKDKLRIIFWEKEKAGTLKTTLRNFRNEQSECFNKMTNPLLSGVSLFVGPEGGFTQGEIDLAEKYGVIRAGLGKQILRSETASLVAVSSVFYEWDKI